MKKLFLVPAFLTVLALPALAGGSATPNKVTITPLPGNGSTSAAATVATAPQAAAQSTPVPGATSEKGASDMLDYSAFGGSGSGCAHGRKTQALIN